MPDSYALALPRKKFFLEMFTRDISLHECILDLIDNSIDGFIRSRHVNLDASHLIATTATPEGEAIQKGRIEIICSPNRFIIRDNCGGITRSEAEGEVFNFGHSGTTAPATQLGAYGIGLKRAIFKIGDHFEMTSQTATEGFSVKVDVDNWSDRDTTLEDWRFPLDYLPGAAAPNEPGTIITITSIPRDIQALLGDPTIGTALHRVIAQTYALFLSRCVDIVLNDASVAPTAIPLGASDNYKPAVDSWEEDGVRVTLIAGLAARGESNEWRAESAGWYVLCNGRVILAADKTELTGWGAGILPQFHSSKSRGFVGIASFSSRDPLKLPWTTTKRSLNRESAVFLRVRDRMATVGRQVYAFLDSLYQSKTDVTPEERRVMTAVSQADFGQVAATGPAAFRISTAPRKQKTTARVQYDAQLSDLAKVRQRLRRPDLSASEIGRQTFEYFLKQEGLQ